ncbi:hypothetical protein [Streptomyces sp. 769]|uniref:hypothetical protein n=1 Tax=Streptomyces sp. 769 TaxID=1262452 RepID=UPI00057E1FF9|nr:hypothetical protein [Streptomyces sp. 769]AJC61674.1 hypothetical protein GZL_09151 [Streptomyces sp. 769]
MRPATALLKKTACGFLGLAFTLHKPGHDPAGNAVAALTDIHRRNYPAGWLATDRAYNAALPETFHIPVRGLGYRPVWDYRIDQLGIQDSHAGTLLIDGTRYCPDVPHPRSPPQPTSCATESTNPPGMPA